MRVRLKELMEARGLNGAQVAEGLGVTPGAVSGWLAGKRRRGDQEVRVQPDLENLDALCAFFECGPGEILEPELAATSTGKTWRDMGPARGRGRQPKAAES